MKKLLMLIVAALLAWSAAANENEKLLVNENFQSWSSVASSTTPTVVNKKTDFSQEDFTYTLSEVQCSPQGWEASRFNDQVASVGYLMAAKTATPYIELSSLSSITRVQFIHGATGSNRGYKLEKKVGSGAWEVVSDAVANPANGTVVNADINGENVALRFTNLNPAQNAYMFDLKIWGSYVSSSPQVNLTTSVSIEGAGTIARSVISDTYDQGATLTLTATRNFGYRFVKWTDEQGATISTNASVEVTLDADKACIAVFEALTTYSFSLNIEGSSWGVVKLSPEPTNGRYEAGVIVTANVVANRVATFSYWEDATSETSRTIQVNGDVSITATFDEIPFIVGWDFVAQEPRSGRAGDYFSETDNTGLINLYKSDGSTVNWLPNGGSFSPLYPCIRKWTTGASFDDEQRYFQASFSTVGYTNIEVRSMMSGNYQVHTKQIMQYSLDGTSFANLKTVDISDAYNASWVDCNATLPQDAEGQAKVYIRWIADVASPKKGGSTDNDGTALTNIFVFADKEIVNDTVPPVLLSTNPAASSSTASANGSIVLTFNEKVKAGTGDITLNGEVLTPVFGAKTASFAYAKLAYNTPYTLTVPLGAITDMSGNAYAGTTFTFTTMNRPQPIAKLFDAVVAADSTGDYTTVQAAIDAAPANRTAPWLIFIKNGSYKGHVLIPDNKPFMYLIGQDKEKVIIHEKLNVQGDPENDKGQSYYANSLAAWEYSVNNPKSVVAGKEGSVVRINGKDFYAENISFVNDWGVEVQNGPQALALRTNNDRSAFYNCSFRSFQDTWQTSTNGITDRTYVNECWLEGAVDYFYGGGDAFVENTTLYNVRSGSVIVAPSHRVGTRYGYVFSSCVVDGNAAAGDGKQLLGRPWHNEPVAVYLNTIMKIKIHPEGWTNMATVPKLFAEYNSMDVNGNPIDLSQRKTSYQQNEAYGGQLITGLKTVLTAEEAAQYTYENVMSGTDGWNPRTLFEGVAKPTDVKLALPDTTVAQPTATLSWSASDYAICYVILKGEEVLGFTLSTEYEVAAVDTAAAYTVRAVGQSGTLSPLSDAAKLDGGSSDDGDEGDGDHTGVVQQSGLGVVYFVHSGQLHLQQLPDHAVVEVYNIVGQKIFGQLANGNAMSISAAKGMCIVRVTAPSGRQVFKIFVN